MLVTNHVLSGAVLGAAVRNPWVAFPLGFASHLALDTVPHWGQFRDQDQFMRVAGMVGAALPDLNKPGKVFFGRSPFPRRFDDFHGRIQDEDSSRFRTHEVPAAAGFAGALAALCVLGRRGRPGAGCGRR